MSTTQLPEGNAVPGQPPSAQEIQRKLNVAQHKGKTRATVAHNSETDTEDESSVIPPNEPTSTATGMLASQPLSAIAERTVSGAEESEDDEDDVAGGWRPPNAHTAGGIIVAGDDTTVLHSGYLWKKGSGRRKTWKKRWFVLRPNHLACYKTAAEYKLIRLLDVSDIHAATPVQLKRHPNACGIVTQARTFYFQADTPMEIDLWVAKINAAKEALQASSLPSTPIVISPSAPVIATGSKNESTLSEKPATSITLAIPSMSPTIVFAEPSSPISPSRSRAAQTSNTSSDSDDGRASASHTKSPLSSSRDAPGPKEKDNKDSGKPVLSGYLMKCGGHRKIWRKRWFILTQTKLMYMGSHMDTKPHRQIMLNQILDAMEYRPAPANHSHRHTSPIRAASELGSSAVASLAESSATQKSLNQPQASSATQQIHTEPYPLSGVNYTFKVFTPKRTYLLCAPSEEEEVGWISAIRALIARRTKEKEAENLGAVTEEAKKASSKPGAAPALKVAQSASTSGAPKSSATAMTAA